MWVQAITLHRLEMHRLESPSNSLNDQDAYQFKNSMHWCDI